jgi:molecular chaperone DnaK (HSP70)
LAIDLRYYTSDFVFLSETNLFTKTGERETNETWYNQTDQYMRPSYLSCSEDSIFLDINNTSLHTSTCHLNPNRLSGSRLFHLTPKDERKSFYPLKEKEGDLCFETEFNQRKSVCMKDLMNELFLNYKKNLNSSVDLEGTIITLPLNTTVNLRHRIYSAALDAGFPKIALFDHTYAEALQYLNQEFNLTQNNTFNETFSSLLVISLSESAFEIMLIEAKAKAKDQELDVVYQLGDSKLGTEDLEYDIVDYLIKQYKNTEKIDLWNNKAAVFEIKKQVHENFKNFFQNQEEVTISVELKDAENDFAESFRKKDLNKIFTRSLKKFNKYMNELSSSLKNPPSKILLTGSLSIFTPFKEIIAQTFKEQEDKFEYIEKEDFAAKGGSIFKILNNTYRIRQHAGFSIGFDTASFIRRAIEKDSQIEIREGELPNEKQLYAEGKGTDTIDLDLMMGEDELTSRCSNFATLRLINPYLEKRNQVELNFQLYLNSSKMLNFRTKSPHLTAQFLL